MKHFPMTAIAAVAIATIASRPRFPDDMSTKFLNIENDGDGSAAVGGGEAASGGQAATGDEVTQSGDPGVLAAAAMASTGQQQAQSDAAVQADGVVIAKGEVVGDDSPATTAVGDPPGTGAEQQA